MKLATLADGSRDGALAVVSRDLKTCQLAHPIAPNLQRALDDWAFIGPQLDNLYLQLNQGKARHAFAFDPNSCTAPLPRAYQWIDASTYPSHIERVLGARGVAIPEKFNSDFLMYQGGSDAFIGPRAAVPFRSEDDGIDFEAELAVITTHLPIGAGLAQCEHAIVLIGLVNDWSLRHLGDKELPKGFGFLQCKPASGFAPVFVTPDELGSAWLDCKPSLTIDVQWNGSRVGRLSSAGMVASFAHLLAHCTRTRELGAGTILGGGTISDTDAKAGYACIAEKRATEIAADGVVKTDYMKFGDTIRIEAQDHEGRSIFGAIEHAVVPLER